MLIQYLRSSFRPLSRPDGDDAGGGGDPEPEGGKVRASDLRSQLGTQVDEQALMRLLEKQADLLTDNHKLREKNRTLRAIPTSAVVLTADEASAWKRYTALGNPDDLDTAIKDRDTAQASLAATNRDRTVRAAADATGLNAAALLALPGLPEIALRETIDADGTAITHAVVTVDGREQALREWGRAAQPALWVAVEGPAAPPQQPEGGRFVRQDAGGEKPHALSAGIAHVKKTNYAIPGKK